MPRSRRGRRAVAGHGSHASGGGRVRLGVLRPDVGDFDECGEGGAEGLGVLPGTLDGLVDGLSAGLPVGGRLGSQGPPGAVHPGEFQVGQSGGQFTEGGEVGEFGGEVDGA